MIRCREADVIVVGAGVAGLTAAAILARAGRRVQVLERHTVPGGCAAFYQRDGYRFDVGATLIGGFGPRGVHQRLFRALGRPLNAVPVEPSMEVRIGDRRIVRYGDTRWVAERRRAFSPDAERFWHRQEELATAAWDYAERFPALPVDAMGLLAAASAFRPRNLPLLGTIGRRLGDLLPDDPVLRAFVDAQLLITAQTDAAGADLAYGVTALDLAREGTYHLPGGISAIAVALARIVRANGGEIAYATSATEIVTERGRVRGVRVDDGSTVSAPAVVAAIPVESTAALAGGPPRLWSRAAAAPQRWGAFTVYVGLPPGAVPEGIALHHQLVVDPARPLGEGNSVFLSFSEPHERERARNGGRAVTISTHTDVARWERARDEGREAALRASHRSALLAALDAVVPRASARAEVIEDGTPATFARYTGRPRGLVGGVPQTPFAANLFAIPHASGVRGLVLAGDTVFPGQSTVGATLSGVNAARAVSSASLRGVL